MPMRRQMPIQAVDANEEADANSGGRCELGDQCAAAGWVLKATIADGLVGFA